MDNFEKFLKDHKKSASLAPVNELEMILLKIEDSKVINLNVFRKKDFWLSALATATILFTLNDQLFEKDDKMEENISFILEDNQSIDELSIEDLWTYK